MDVPRGKEVARKKLIRRIVVITVIVAAIPLITWGLSRLKPAAPSVDRATVWIDSVKRGPMLREVRGLGTLVVEEFVWIPAQFDARVEKINFLPGAKVHPNDVVMILKQPQMELDASDLEAQVKQAQAQYDNLRVQLQSAQLTQEATTQQVKSDMEQAELQADRDRQLNKLDLKSDVDTKVSQAKSDELKNRYIISKKQFDISGESIKAQLDAQKVLIDNLKAKVKLKKEQVDQLTIRAGVEGVVTQLGTSTTPLEAGMRVAPGTILAKIAQPTRLKATLKIPETQVKDVAPGQVADIDTRNGHHCGARHAYRSGVDKRDCRRGREVGRRSSRHASRSERRWNHHHRASGGRGLRWPPGNRTARRQDHIIQTGCGWKRSAAHSGIAGTKLGEHDRSCGRLEGWRSGNIVGHVYVGCA